MKLNQLQYFCAVCECQSVTRAAEKLYISQPSISSAIRALETEMGLKLFHRVYHSLIPTAEGEYFYHRVQALLAHTAELAADMEQRRLQMQTVQLGLPPMIAMILSDELLTPFKTLHPDVPIQIEQAGSLTNAEAVREERLDMTLMLLGAYSTGFNQISIRESEIVLAVPQTHPLAARHTIEPGALRGLKMASLPEDTVLHATLDKLYKRHHIAPNVQFQDYHVQTLLDYMQRENCAALLLRDVVGEGFAAIPFQDPMPVEIGLVWKKRSYLNAGVEKFIRYVRRFPKEIAG